MSAVDLAQPVTEEMANQMAAAKVGALRYLSYNAAKNLGLGEARMLASKQIPTAVVWEALGNEYASFTAAQGRADAQHALLEATALKIPKGRTLYFCGADFDASAGQIAGGINDYMTAVNPLVIAAGYLVGVYGNGAVCAWMLDHGLADKAWLWGAEATNGTQAFLASGRWSIHQRPTTREFGASVDPDDTQGDWGQFFVPLPPAAQQPAPGTSIVPAAVTMQQALAGEGLYLDRIDGIWGDHSAAALAAHYRGAADA